MLGVGRGTIWFGPAQPTTRRVQPKIAAFVALLPIEALIRVSRCGERNQRLLRRPQSGFRLGRRQGERGAGPVLLGALLVSSLPGLTDRPVDQGQFDLWFPVSDNEGSQPQ